MAGDQIVEEIEQQALLGLYEEALKLELPRYDWRIESIGDALCSVTSTGEATPGDPQHSYKNILRAGFSEAYLRENWIPANG